MSFFQDIFIPPPPPPPLGIINVLSLNDDIPVMLNSQLIPRVYISCLGVTLDGTLSWGEHIETICKKVGVGIGTL
jgi:hypothetical protein